MMTSWDQLEQVIFGKFATDVDLADVPIVFILGSPRTGSTLLYQLFINFFPVVYFSNATNDLFSDHPSIGLMLHQQLTSESAVSYESAYGKTKEYFEPSESSLIHTHWFGGEQPAQINSKDFLPEKAEHFELTMRSIWGMFNKPILIKNAWNCFRIDALAKRLKHAHFIWIRRDIVQSAVSDLRSRKFHGSATIWNSATTANYKEIQLLKPWQQVIEQQYEYNNTIGADLKRFAPDRYLEIWYEDICDDVESQVSMLDHFLTQRSIVDKRRLSAFPVLSDVSHNTNDDEDSAMIKAYVQEHFSSRLHTFCYQKNRSSASNSGMQASAKWSHS